MNAEPTRADILKRLRAEREDVGLMVPRLLQADSAHPWSHFPAPEFPPCDPTPVANLQAWHVLHCAITREIEVLEGWGDLEHGEIAFELERFRSVPVADLVLGLVEWPPRPRPSCYPMESNAR